MRRVLRWLVNGLCPLSLLAILAAAWLCLHGGRVYVDRVSVVLGGVSLDVLSRDGLIVLNFSRGAIPPFPAGVGSYPTIRAFADDGPVARVDRERQPGGGQWLGVRYHACHYHLQVAPGGSRALRCSEWRPQLDRGRPAGVRLASLTAEIPDATAFAVTALPALLWLVSGSRRLYVRRRRRRLGLCPRCGYDLRGNTSGTCSECGEAVTAGRRVTS